MEMANGALRRNPGQHDWLSKRSKLQREQGKILMFKVWLLLLGLHSTSGWHQGRFNLHGRRPEQDEAIFGTSTE